MTVKFTSGTIWVILTILIYYLTMSNALDLTLELKGLEDRLLHKMEQIQVNLETKLDSIKNSLNMTITRVDILEKSNLKLGANSHPNFKPVSKTMAMTSLLIEIQAKMENLTTASATTGHSNETLVQLHSVKRSLQLELRTLRNRLDDLKREIQSENLEMSTLLMQQVQNVTTYLAQVQSEERGKIRTEILRNVTTSVRSRQLNLAREQLKLFLPDELEEAIPEVVSLIYEDDMKNFDKIFNFIQSLPSDLYTPMVKNLIERITQKKGDEPQLIRLAYEVRGRLGSRLRSKFPSAIQGLVFQQNCCIRNSFSNQFLIVNWDKEHPSGFLAHTRKGSIDNETSSEFCGWQIYPVNDVESFIIRMDTPPHMAVQIEQLNLSSNNATVLVGEGSGNFNYFWKICTRKSGKTITIQRNGGPLKDFLCVAPFNGVGDKNRRNLVMNKSFERSCEWVVHSPM